MKFLKLVIVLTLTQTFFTVNGQKITEKELGSILSLPDKSKIRERIIYLSDDKLKGRLPGTEGYQMAVDFVTSELKNLGVKPKGTDGYIQSVVLRKGVVDTTQSSMKLISKDGSEK